MKRKPFKTTTILTGLAILLLSVFLGGCGNKPSSNVVTQADINAQKKLIKDYYSAINRGDYENAYSLTTKEYRKGRSYLNFKFQYQNYIKNVKVNSITRMEEYSNVDSAAYDVSFDAIYKHKYQSGDGNLPAIHVVQKDKKNEWKIDSIGIKQ